MQWTRSVTQLFNRSPRGNRRRVQLDTGLAPVFVVGDVHGCLDLLRTLDDRIGAEASGLASWPYTILVGDLIDRGEKSAAVLDYVIERQAADERFFCLAGNHEVLMLDFLAAPSPRHQWLALGGSATLASYGVESDGLRTRDLIAAAQRSIPQEHLDFLSRLPVAVETQLAFVSHAGIRPDRPFALQEEVDLLWFRDGMMSDYGSSAKVVVHGHDPQAMPRRHGQRINVDTGAYATGKLTAVRLDAGASVNFLTAEITSGSPVSLGVEVL